METADRCPLPTYRGTTFRVKTGECGGTVYEYDTGPDAYRKCERCGSVWSMDSKEDAWG